MIKIISMLSIPINSVVIINYFEKLYSKNISKLNNKNKFWEKATIISIFQIIFFILFSLKYHKDNIYFFLLELLFLLILTKEDEMSLEISVNIIFIYFLYKVIFVILYWKFDFLSFFAGNLIFIFIFFISRGGMGLGDVILNGILSLAFNNFFEYFTFFTLTFFLGAVFSIFGLITKSLERQEKIGFIKFISMSYIIILLLR